MTVLDITNFFPSAADLVAFLDRDALALIATMPGEAMRLALLVSLLRRAR
jgi:hypothetical protein